MQTGVRYVCAIRYVCAKRYEKAYKTFSQSYSIRNVPKMLRADEVRNIKWYKNIQQQVKRNSSYCYAVILASRLWVTKVTC
jgi:hypothetical protein